MKKKYVISLILLAILIVSGIGLTLSYALWQSTKHQTGESVVNTGCFQIDFVETGNDINLTNAYPISDEEGLKGVPYKFKVTNNCSINAKYVVTLNSFGDKSKLMNDNAIAYAFNVSTKTQLQKKILANAKENKETSYIDIDNLAKSYILEESNLDVGETREYQLLLWMDEATTTTEANKLFPSKIYINAAAAEAPIISNAYLMKAPPYYVESSKTVLGNEDILKEKIENIYTLDTKEVPEDAIESWDVSSDQSGDIMAYIKANGEDKYDLYIGQDGGVKANPDSSYLFAYYELVKTIDLSHFDTSKVTNMSHMFSSRGVLKLDLSSFDTSKVTNMSYMFSGCSALAELDLSSFDTSNVTNMYFMFSGCRALAELDVSKFDTSKVTDMGYMFDGCNSLTQLNLSSFDTSNVMYMQAMFMGYSALTQLDLSHFDTSKVTDMSYMFYGCRVLAELDVSKFDTSKVINMSYMFSGCSALTQLDLSHFDTTKVTRMNYMFDGCNSLTQLNLSSFDTSNVTDMEVMFRECNALAQLNLSSFDTSNVTDMRLMFSGCSALTQLDLRNMIFDKVGNANASQSFYNISSTITIYVKDGTQADKIKSFGATGTIISCADNVCP